MADTDSLERIRKALDGHQISAWCDKADLRSLLAREAALREALAELVALEDERIRLRQLHEMGHGTDYDHYHKSLQLAWDAARAALASTEPT